MPLAIQGGPCIINNSKHISSSGENTVKITSNRTNDGIEMNRYYSPDEVTKYLAINPYKEAILKESTKTRDQVAMKEWSILSDHFKYVTHGKSETFQKLSINSMNYR